MFWSRLGLIGLTVLWLAASTARAQTDLPLDPIAPDQTKPTETGLFLEIPSVYGAAKYDQKVNEAPAAVIIITAEQIRKYGYRDFAQILDSAPGLFTNNDRNYGYLGIRGFNRPGDYTSRILLLVDNHRLNDAVFDQDGAGTEMPIDVDLIDRIEIIKGQGSSLYGTNAFFGVVNVITIRGRDIKGAEVSGKASSFNTYRSRLSYGTSSRMGWRCSYQVPSPTAKATASCPIRPLRPRITASPRTRIETTCTTTPASSPMLISPSREATSGARRTCRPQPSERCSMTIDNISSMNGPISISSINMSSHTSST